MNILYDELGLIINKAKKLGLNFQTTQQNQWIIYLKPNWVLFQIDTGWLLSVNQKPQIYISSSRALKFLEQLTK
ncbi:hypothetical protein [Gloeothece verrucosa]|uniref:Uncharacterized protein n=1 Tax=Gloeothece verrucosa (strain PCC 7822) TaxID=497965 RepID=E0UN67_GLOV7|nr:hypothetical protein [Gloeothece verrucosa]ADN18397.1 hypothetical protein Cyan7822_6719 [Gloeothece verrucosa PCC 7822]